MKISRKTIVVLFMIISSAQSGFNQITFAVTIKDINTKEAIDLAHVFLKNKQQIGVVSNQVGHVSFVVPEIYQWDTIVISQLGYEPLFIPIHQIENQPEEVFLETQNALLQEVTIISVDALRDIVMRAFKMVEKNYPLSVTQMNAYYQEYNISDSAYTGLIEMALVIEDGGYVKKETGVQKSKIYKKEIRRTDDVSNLPPRIKQFTKNPLYGTNDGGNNVKNRRLSWVADMTHNGLVDFRSMGKYTEGKDTLIDIWFGTALLHKSVESELTVSEKDYFDQGTITINLSDFGIVFLKSYFGHNEEKSSQEIRFQRIKNKYYPLYVKRIMGIKYDQRTRSLIRSTFMLYHDIKLSSKDYVKTKRKNLIKHEKDLRKIKYKYNPIFWATYNAIKKAPISEAMLKDLQNSSPLELQFSDGRRN